MAGVVLFLLALGYVVYAGIRSAAVYYVTPSEFFDLNPQRRTTFVRIAGRVPEGSIRRDEATQTWTFVISDGRVEIAARYQGIPPELFVVTREVIAEGRMGPDGVFRVQTLLATHPTEYRERRGGGP